MKKRKFEIIVKFKIEEEEVDKFFKVLDSLVFFVEEYECYDEEGEVVEL